MIQLVQKPWWVNLPLFPVKSASLEQLNRYFGQVAVKVDGYDHNRILWVEATDLSDRASRPAGENR